MQKWAAALTALVVLSCRQTHQVARVSQPERPPLLSDRPAGGQSLFDELTKGRPAFPFEKLLADLTRTNTGRAPKAVLIPLGRSLQRVSAAPDFFDFPRVVVAFDSGPLRDRLFMGYQEKANVIEVISYSEDAGRFEFQLVENYGAAPQVKQPRREDCTRCHQNRGPIFPRPLWDETNGNAHIVALLSMRHRAYHGVPIAQGVDVPNAIDDATDRANEFALVQTLWAAGPDARWRRAVVRAALVPTLPTAEPWYGSDVVEPAVRKWKQNWPVGLRVPSADIPNRDPLLLLPPNADPKLLLARQNDIDGRFEPSNPRTNHERWYATADQVDRFIRSVAGMFAGEALARVKPEAIATAPSELFGDGPLRPRAILRALARR